MPSAIASSSASSSEQVRDVVAARLQAVGQRLTSNRQALLDALTAAARPLTIPEILDDMRAGKALVPSASGPSSSAS
jgi:Fe2+ or Zn2+ uptake regulation protein